MGRKEIESGGIHSMLMAILLKEGRRDVGVRFCNDLHSLVYRDVNRHSQYRKNPDAYDSWMQK